MSSVRFTLSFWLPEPTGVEGEQKLVEKFHVPGQLLALDANGGEALGLYLNAFVIE